MIGKTISHYPAFRDPVKRDKILEKLGEGGMGIVYKAHDLKLDRFVAIKSLPQRIMISEADKDRFFQEARAAITLRGWDKIRCPFQMTVSRKNDKLSFHCSYNKT